MSADPWTWLLDRTPAGAWRHVPYQATELGQGQDPSLEARVEVIRRLIAYPASAFATVIQAVQALDRPDQPVRWLCYRDPGSSPARPYWLCFVSSRPGGRRFHFGLELFDRERLGLWFFSGYAPDSVPPELLAPFPARPEVSLPRVELTDHGLRSTPLAEWLRDAWSDRLRFTRSPSGRLRPLSPSAAGVDDDDDPDSADLTGLLAPSIASLPPDDGALGLRFARARLLVQEHDAEGKPTRVKAHALSRLTTLVGRDPRCDVVLEHRNISAEHARITWRHGKPVLEELGSKNGTTVDGKAVTKDQPAALAPETALGLGGVLALFIQDLNGAAPAAEEGEEPPPQRHADRVAALVKGRRLTAEDAERVLDLARRRGVTAGELLLTEGRVGLEEWVRPKKDDGGCGGAAALLLLAVALLLLTGCTSLGLPPLYEQDLEPQPMREGTRRVEWDFDVGFRPLFQARAQKSTERVEAHLLFPLGMLDKRANEQTVRLYPVYQSIQRVDPDGFPDDDTIVFPFVFTGTHPVEGDYLYVFPFGGKLRGLLGKDEAVGVLFPLYGWARRGETFSHHVLFPLISLTYGGGESGFRVLPFYGHFEKRRPDGELVFNRTTVLWPLFSWAEESTNSRNPYSSLVVFPFWGRTRSAWMDDDTILWPLFRWWTDKRTGYSEVRAPFPFFIYGRGPEHVRVDVWPFYGFRERGGYTRHFLLWPIGRHEREETEEYVDTRLWILPLFWSHVRRYKDPSAPPGTEAPAIGEDREVNVFPFLRYERRRDGFFEVRALAPLWFQDPLLNFETILGPLWTLFRYRRDAEGYTRVDLLLGLYSYRSAPTGESRWDILGGLVGHSESPEGGKTRLLWFLEF